MKMQETKFGKRPDNNFYLTDEEKDTLVNLVREAKRKINILSLTDKFGLLPNCEKEFQQWSKLTTLVRKLKR
tara:strand:+ start:385 stop:600 length:216 start_codon:yes stop_codon:yes gene_type:complete